MEFNDRRRDVHERGQWTTFKNVKPGDRVVVAQGLFRSEQDARASDVPAQRVVSAGHEMVPETRYEKDPATGKYSSVPTGQQRRTLRYRVVDPSGNEQVFDRPGARRLLHLPKESE